MGRLVGILSGLLALSAAATARAGTHRDGDAYQRVVRVCSQGCDSVSVSEAVRRASAGSRVVVESGN